MNELALFTGAGGGILGSHLLGWKTVCAVEWADYPRKVLLARQRDGILPRFPIWDDVQTFDGNPWRGRIDIVTGGFPCQDISAAGKGKGIDGERSGMWKHFARIIGEVQPKYAFVENSPMLTSRGLGRVLGDLAEMGYDAEWGVLGAHDCGAPHKRDRIWIFSYSKHHGQPSDQVRRSVIQAIQEKQGWTGESFNASGVCCLSETEGYVADTESRESRKSTQWQGREGACRGGEEDREGAYAWWATEPELGRVANGVAHRVDRLKAIGNGQVPAVAALAFKTLSGL